MKLRNQITIIIAVVIIVLIIILSFLKSQEKYNSFDLICKSEGMNKFTDYRNKGNNCYYLECDNKEGLNIPVKKEYYCNKDKFGDNTIFGCDERYVISQKCLLS